MFRSIKSKLVVSVIVMAALLGALIYFSSARLNELETTLNDLQTLQEFKTHVMAPQKDMNQFIAGIEATILSAELGDAEAAQDAYESTVDAEQDISVEFAELEKVADPKLAEMAADAHVKWEVATEFMKVEAEKAALDRKVALVRPSTEPTKVVDEHTGEAAKQASTDYAKLTLVELTSVADNDESNPVEVADVAIDGLDEFATEMLAEEKAAGEASLAAASQSITWGSVIVLAGIVLIGAAATTSVSRPLGALKTGAEKIAEGDLDYKFGNVPADEVGSVIHSVEKMSGSLRERIRNLEEVAGVVMLTGEEIESAAASVQPPSPQSEQIADKARTLKGLVGQMLNSTKH